jgi:hypothetical protein
MGSEYVRFALPSYSSGPPGVPEARDDELEIPWYSGAGREMYGLGWYTIGRLVWRICWDCNFALSLSVPTKVS